MKVLIVIDMQRDFVDGALGTEEAQAIVGHVKNKIKTYHSQGYRLVYTKDTHTSGYLNTQEGKMLPVEHCIKGTPGWEFCEGVYVEGATVVEKPSFGSQDLPEILKQAGEPIDEIELIGLCTDICVLSNAMILKAHFPECPLYVDPICCAGVTPESHDNALRALKMCQVIVRV